MNTSLDCIPCFVRQALDAARLLSTDTAVHEQILQDVLIWTSEMRMDQSAPVMGQRIHRRLRELLGVDDPYRAAKDRQNSMAMALLPELRATIDAAADPRIMALRLAIAGNIIDMGVNANVSVSDVHESIRQALTEPFVGSADRFRNAVTAAGHILYLADNAGEIVFDRLLIEQLSPARVTVAVRGGPAINDATMADARAAGLDQIVEVVDNGSDAPGTILDDCSPAFRRRFDAADLILAKGQGNFETLSDVAANILFLFKAKCHVVAEHALVPRGAQVVTGTHAGRADWVGSSVPGCECTFKDGGGS